MMVNVIKTTLDVAFYEPGRTVEFLFKDFRAV